MSELAKILIVILLIIEYGQRKSEPVKTSINSIKTKKYPISLDQSLNLMDFGIEYTRGACVNALAGS